MRRTHLITAAAAALALVGSTFAPANAADGTEVVGGLVTPLSVAVAQDGTIYVSQNFAGLLTAKAPGHDAEVVYEAEGKEVGAVSVDGTTVTFATTAMGGPQDTRLWTLNDDHTATEVADLWAHERAHNPDGGRKYGIRGLDRACKRAFNKHTSWMVGYRGIKESHPYASTTVDGTTYVADAAANAIFAVRDGMVSTVAVLPATTVKVTRKIRRSLELPRCAQGHDFKLEAVPTDVEVGPDGNLYITSLPGGPEVPAMGANGSVYRLVPSTGAVSAVQPGGLVTPTGYAVGPTGTSYISMIFASTVLSVPDGGAPAPFAEVALPGDVEYANGKVYVTVTDLMNDGSTGPAGQVLEFNAS